MINFDKLGEKLSKLVGFEDSITDATKELDKKVSDALGGAGSFADLLNYKYFDDDIFYGDDGSAGFLLKLSPIVGSNDNHIKNLELFFNDELPLGGVMQFSLIASNNIDPIINAWKDQGNIETPLLNKLRQSREDFLRKTANNFKEYAGRNARNYKLYLSYTEKNPNKKKLTVFMQTLQQKLATIDLNPKILCVEDLILMVREILEVNFASQKKKSYCHYNKQQLISDQILTPTFRHDITEDRIEHRETDLASRSYFAQSLPEEFSLNNMINLLGDSSRSHLSIPGRFIITYVITNNLNKAAQNGIISRGDRVVEASEQWYSRNNRNLIREAQEWRDVSDRFKNGERFLNEYFQVTITAPTNLLEEAEQNFYSLYNLYSWRMEPLKYFQLPAMMVNLPFHSNKLLPYLAQFKLSKTSLSSEVLAKLPVHAEWTGTGIAGMVLHGRRGQLFHWNPFYRISSGNYNVCIFGPSGSGKSVFMQDLATSMMRQDCKIFALDIGRSFKKLALDDNGEFISFGKDSDIVLNPFSGFDKSLSEEDRLTAIVNAKAIIVSMCKANGDNLKETIVEKAIKLGLEKYNANLDITLLSEVMLEVGQSLKGAESIAHSLSLALYPYTKNGIFAKFFSPKEGGSTKGTKFEKQITVFEFEEIRDQNLLSVVLQIISMQIFMQVLTGDRTRKFMLIVDEAWRILDHSAQFLAELARTLRKYNGSLVTCVQDYSDMCGSEYRKTILANSTWTIILKQDEKDLEKFKSSEAFKDMLPLIKSISVVPEKYSECLIYSTGIRVVGRLVLDNFANALYSTDKENTAAIEQLIQTGTPMLEAVEIVEERKNATRR